MKTMPAAYSHVVTWKKNPFRYTYADFLMEKLLEEYEPTEEELKEIAEEEIEEFATFMQ